MTRTIYVFFEGDGKLVPGFNAFFRSAKEAARRRGMDVRPVAGGATAVRDFNWARSELRDAAAVLLLVDSEGAVDDDPRHAPSLQPHLGHLVGVKTERLHLMVQAMEAWFLVDREVLAAHFGRGFRPNHLPRNPQVEHIPKEDVLRGLKEATRETGRGEYHKTKDAPAILAHIDPAAVRKAAPACERFLSALERIVGSDDGSKEGTLP